ncbi:MAG: CARDB domain-containing protein, partial [Nannocystaceae bacterium]
GSKPNSAVARILGLLTGSENNYRQNVQGNGVFNAPDLAVDLALGLEQCNSELELVATVKNKGALGVEPGVNVKFYEGVDATGTLLGEYMTDVPLLPGGSTKIIHVVDAPPPGMTADYFVEVDHASMGNGEITECDESNNTNVVTDGQCPGIG